MQVKKKKVEFKKNDKYHLYFQMQQIMQNQDNLY